MPFGGRLRLWHIVVLAALLLGGLFAGYYYLDTVRAGEDDGGLTENEQLVAVERGDLVTQVQTGGALTLPRRETIRLGDGSIVKDVLVTEGQAVIEGQALFTLDDATVAQHDMEVAKARIALRDAEAALAELSADATSALVDAEAALADAERALERALSNHAEAVSTTTDALRRAERDYQDVFSAWLGITLQAAELQENPDELLANWSLDLEWLLAADGPLSPSGNQYWQSVPADDPTTRWSETALYGVATFYPGTIIATCEDTNEHPINGHCLKKGFDESWDALVEARDALDDAVGDSDGAVKKAETDLTTARGKHNEAVTAVQDAGDGDDGYTRQLREAELVTARVALDEALERREDATVRAPIDGIVAVLNAVAGEPVDQESRIAVEIIDTSVVELVGLIDETDVLRIDYGDAAEVTLDALSGQVFSGEITSISSAAEQQQGIAVFEIKIRVNVPQDVDLREGMNATARMAVQRQTDVLLVPVQSIYGTFAEPLLRVMVDGEILARPVRLGATDEFWVVVDDGATEGEQIIMHVSAADEFGGFFGGPGAGRQTSRAIRVSN